jgi:hypothetical protein
VTASKTGDGYGNLPTVFSVFQSTSWWLDKGANVHMCDDIATYSSNEAARGSSILIGNRLHHVPSINKNLVSGSLLCRDRFKVLKSDKLVMSKHG